MQSKIEVIGMPNLSAIIGAESHIDWPGGTISDMIGFLTKNHGPEVQQLLLDDQSHLDAAIQVMINKKGFLPREKIASHRLNDGDSLIFVLLAAGG